MASHRRLVQGFAFASHSVHHHRRRRRPVLEVLEGRALLATLTVNSLGDAGSGSNDAGDLLYCIGQANADDQANTIVFDPTVFGTPQTITLSGGQLELSDTGGTQTITGPAAGLTVSGGEKTRVFQVDSGVTASISGMTITGGNSGGLANYGTATLIECTITGNASPNGGGVINSGTATLIGCTISDNNASYSIYTYTGYGYGSFRNGGTGGGVLNYGTAILNDCTVSGNFAFGLGGGVENADNATLTMSDCTVSGDRGDGGAVSNGGTAYLTDCTVSDNYGFGAFNFGPGDLTMSDTIVAGNTISSGASDIGGAGFSGSYNLIGTGGSGGLVNGVDGNIVGVADPLLAPLGDYGGPTQTIALLAGSPALGAGTIADYPGTTTPITTDQRGLPLDSPDPDIGAFQNQGSPLIGPTFSVSDQSITYGTPSVTISGTLAYGSQAPVGEGVAVTLDGVEQSATIGSGGAFSTTFATTGLTVVDSPYTIAYAYTTDGTFIDASTTSTLTVTPPTTTITFTVNSLGDAGTGSDDAGDLRYCIAQANADDGTNQIVFDPTVFGTPQTITLSGGQLELEDTGGTQTITGPAAGLTIDGSGSSRVFQVDSGVTASISGLTIAGGLTSSGGSLVFNDGTAILTGCTFSGNDTNYSDSITYSHDGTYGGGVGNGGGADLTMSDCTVSGNTTVANGGGVNNYGTATLTGCTISDDSGDNGGGVFNSGLADLTMSDCTVSGNVGEFGGGVYNGGTAILTGCTISGNDATYSPDAGNDATFAGGGLFSGSGPLTLTDTIVAGNADASAASDIEIDSGSYNGIFSGSYNLIGTGGSGGLVNGVDGNIVGVADPLLAPLGDYGGPTQTIALLADSPAIGAGIAVPGVTADQRGEPLDSPNPDIGAFQTQALSLIAPTFSVSDQTITYGTSGVTISGTLADGSQAPAGETVAITLNGLEQSPTIGPGGTFSTTFDADGLNVTGSPDTVTYAYTSDGTFASESTTSTLTITPATLTITADPETKVYGTEDPALAYTATGFQFNDTAATVLTGELARAEAGTPAGEQAGGFAITRGSLAADSNYTIQFTGNTLTITPATLTVTADPQTKVYGTADPGLTDTATGFIDTTVDGVTIDDTAATVLTGNLARAAGETVSGGPYAITRGTLAADNNYIITFTGSALTITPATLTIAALPETKVFGSADPTLAYTVSGFRFSDTAATVLTGSLARTPGETVPGGPYAIGQGTLAADGNYTIQFTGSSLSITPAAPELTVSDPGGTYTGAPIAAMATVTGVDGTAAPSLEGIAPTLTYYAGTGTSGADLGSAAPSAAGTYTVVARFPGSADYASAESQPATFVIAPVNSGPAAGPVSPAAGPVSPATGPVSPAATAIDLVPHAVLEGKKLVGLTAEIGPVVPGGVVPTGQVTFEFITKHRKKVTVKKLGTAELSGGEATLTVKLNRVLKEPLTVVYSGDPDFLASTMSLPKLTRSRIASLGT